MIGNICEDSVFVEMFDLHDKPFLDEEEILSFGPGVLCGVAVYFPLFQKLLILLIQLKGNGNFLRRVVAFVQEKVVVLVFLVYLLLEQILYFLQVSQSIHIGNLVLFRVVIDLVVVQFVIVPHRRGNTLQQGFALY